MAKGCRTYWQFEARTNVSTFPIVAVNAAVRSNFRICRIYELLDVYNAHRGKRRTLMKDNNSSVNNGRLQNYAKTALERECSNIQRTQPGNRNTTLNAAAFRIGQLVGANLITFEHVHQELLSAAIESGLPRSEAIATIKSGLEAGVKKPRDTNTAPCDKKWNKSDHDAKSIERECRVRQILAEAREPNQIIFNYLEDFRGLTGSDEIPGIHFHPGIKHGADGQTYPCMVCKFSKCGEINQDTVGVHVTFLKPDGDGTAHVVDRAGKDVSSKRMFSVKEGALTGAAIWIGEPEDVLLISEGIENGIAGYIATGLPVAACGSNTLMKSVIVPADTRRVIILLDPDDAGRKAASELAQRLYSNRIDVLIAVPHVNISSGPPDKQPDFNDVFKAHGSEGTREQIEQAELWTPPPPNMPIIFRRAADIEIKPIEWLWPGRIALGKIAMIAGNPGLGKSMAMASIASCVSNGAPFPLCDETRPPGNVIILSAEDDASDTIVPRLQAAGADKDRCFIIESVKEEQKDGSSITRAFNLQSDLSRLEKMFLAVGRADLIIVDPISAYMGNVDSHKNTDVRAALAPLSKMAEHYRTAFAGVTHLNKSTGGDALMRFTGSLAFVAAARSAFLVARDNDQLNRRLFLPVKNNLASDTAGLAFQIEAVTLPNNIQTSRVAWEHEPIHITADEALASSPDPEERDAIKEAIEFLREILLPGPKPATSVMADANALKITEKTLRTARQRLGIKPNKQGFGKESHWVWSLPPDDKAGSP